MCKKKLYGQFEFRNILLEEAEQAAEIEKICFPPNEACSKPIMKERIIQAPRIIFGRSRQRNGKACRLFKWSCYRRRRFSRDAFFEDVRLHVPTGGNVMLLGLDVLPKYRGKGLARELVSQYFFRERNRGRKRKRIILTCLESKVKMYEKMGFCELSGLPHLLG